MVSADYNFPSNTTPANVQIFPAAYCLDLDFDQKKDLVVAPNANNVSENENSVWYYKNLGSNQAPVFVYQDNDWLQGDMIDHGAGSVPLLYDVNADGTLSAGRPFCTIDQGGPDGIRVDARGHVWSSAGDGVQIFSVSGKLIGRILCPEGPANLAFGGKDGQTLFMTSRTGLYAVPVLTGPATRPAAR